MDSLKERCQVILLPTEGKSILWTFKGQLQIRKDLGEVYNFCQNLYICSNREIKEKDWCINYNKDTLYQIKFPNYSDKYNWYRIEASTDKSLGLPSVSEEFLQKYVEMYNKGTAIGEVMVEIEEYDIRVAKVEGVEFTPFTLEWDLPPVLDCKFRPKVRKDNTIIISKLEETWDNVYDRFQSEYYSSGNQNDDLPDFQKWLKENYSVPQKI